MLVSVRIHLAAWVAAATTLAAFIAPTAPAQAEAAAALTCTASVSDATPRQYSNVYVRVRTSAYARVRTVAHYKTTNTVKRTTASSTGRANVRYYISGATPGYRVRVDVTVTKNGRSRSCSTSFVPHR